MAPALDKYVITVSGLSIKKQDTALIVRDLGDKIVHALLHQQESTILPLIKAVLDRLLCRDFTLADVSTSISIAESYSGDNYVQVTLSKLVEGQTGVPVQPGSRINYVIHGGQEKMYQRGVPLDMADLAKVDIVYLIQNQLEKPISALLEFNVDILMRSRQMIANAIRTATVNAAGLNRLA